MSSHKEFRDIVWRSMDGTERMIKHLSDGHLANIIGWVNRNLYPQRIVDGLHLEVKYRGLSDEFINNGSGGYDEYGCEQEAIDLIVSRCHIDIDVVATDMSISDLERLADYYLSDYEYKEPLDVLDRKPL